LIGTLIGSSLTLLFIPKQIQEKEIPPELLKEDVEFLFRSIEEMHPNPYLYTNKSEIYKIKEIIKTKTDHPMTRIEFYKLIAPLVAKLKDGHTEVYPPFYQFTSEGTLPVEKPEEKLFPLKVEIFGTRAFVAEEYKKIEKGSELLEINGVNLSELIEELKKYKGSEREALILELVELDFSELLHVELGSCEKFEIKLQLPSGEVKKYILEGTLSKGEMRLPSNPYTFKIINNNTALLTLDTFMPIPNQDTCRVFLKGAFTEIKEKSIGNLIIDIRKNFGGDSRNRNMLLEYLTDRPYKNSKGSYQKVSEPLIQVCKELGVYEKYLKGYKPGDMIFYEPSLVKPEPTPLKFNGNVYVLTSRETASSAMGFADIIKYNKIGKIVGEETGDTVISFSNSLLFELPNSRLVARSSTQYSIGLSAEKHGKGVIPDYKVEFQPEDLITGKDRALEFTLNLIEWKKWK
jgi:hypothetical protein